MTCFITVVWNQTCNISKECLWLDWSEIKKSQIANCKNERDDTTYSTHKIPKLPQNEMSNLERHVFIKEVEFVILKNLGVEFVIKKKNLPKETPGPR